MTVAKFVGIVMLVVPSALVAALMFTTAWETPSSREAIFSGLRFLLVAAYVTFALWLVSK